MSTAVEVPAAEIVTFLTLKGFTRRATSSDEIVFERAHEKDKRLKVLVYTSVRRGAAVARAVGKDAIRVAAIFEDGSVSKGVAKLPRVHRTGSVEKVLARVLERMRLAYARCSEYRKQHLIQKAAS